MRPVTLVVQIAMPVRMSATAPRMLGKGNELPFRRKRPLMDMTVFSPEPSLGSR